MLSSPQSLVQSREPIALRVFNGDGRVKVSGSDNGIGISPENFARIFNPGFGRHSGTLAGKELGGALRVESQGVGQGTTFTLRLSADSDRPN